MQDFLQRRKPRFPEACLIRSVNHSNLTQFLSTLIFRAATTSLCGPYMFELNPTFSENFWGYIRDIPVLYKGLPRW